MDFVAKTLNKGGILVGHLKDDDGRSIEVRYNPLAFPEKEFMCEYKDRVISANSIGELQKSLDEYMGFAYDWKDIIRVRVLRRKTDSCPMVVSTEVDYTLLHISKAENGKWVSSDWNPGVDSKGNIRALYPGLPEDIEFPCKRDGSCYNGTETFIYLPYSEANLALVKSFQLSLVDQVGQFLDSLKVPGYVEETKSK